MNYLSTLLFWSISSLAFCQELPRVIKKVKPALFINNIDNERVYQQANIRENLVVFSRNFENRPIEEVQQSFHYSFLDTKHKTWLLEFQFDRHDIKLHKGLNMEPVGCNDLGFKVYTKKENNWKDCTLESLPDDFLLVVSKHFQTLQKSGLGMYFYNQDPAQAVSIFLEKNKLIFRQNGKIKLSLAWKKEGFVWKNKTSN
ncbi:MAG: Unknown protein [uncultured Aureispira sp.]|uniref:Uncharacterized protein n=1 Tax=uncultured Aureispira sp. TaxID=1331704 RepID=A0A6S6UDS8_9BACT|nr:MAG: Unknown protein [uncultured Aureispira sp.]